MNPPSPQAGAELLELLDVVEELELLEEVREEVEEVVVEVESELVLVGLSEFSSLVDVGGGLLVGSSVIVISGSGTSSGTSGGPGTAGGIGAPTGMTIGGIGIRGKTVMQIGLPQLQFKVVFTGTPSQTWPVVQLKDCITVVTG